MAFAKKTSAVKVDGVEMVVSELTAKQQADVEAIDGWEGNRRRIILQTAKSNGDPMFATETEIDDLPSHVVAELLRAVEGLHKPKN